MEIQFLSKHRPFQAGKNTAGQRGATAVKLEDPGLYKQGIKRKFSPTGHQQADEQRAAPSYEVGVWREARKRLKSAIVY